jgi:pimeloyl-ACP methyl ester carboxylesterase
MHQALTDAPGGHLFVYTPIDAGDERLPLLLFLHGSGGNFKVYTHLLRNVADRRRCVVVAPSFGFGNWYRPGGTETIERARTFAEQQLHTDPARVILMALSNGGTGATRVLASSARPFAATIFLSAVMEPEVMEMEAFARAVEGRPSLLLTGARDDRIPLRHELVAEERLREAGALVEMLVDPGEDHFLWFDRPEDVDRALDRFLGDVLGSDGSGQAR